MNHPRSSTRRAVTLIEAVIVVLVISLAVPPMLTLVDTIAGSRAESARISLATSLAQGVMEQVLADTLPEDGAPGLDALADPDAYVSTPNTGLRDRLAWLAEPYAERWGIDYSVEIGGPIAADGAPSGDASRDIYRMVTVAVQIPGETERFELSVAALVGGAQ